MWESWKPENQKKHVESSEHKGTDGAHDGWASAARASAVGAIAGGVAGAVGGHKPMLGEAAAASTHQIALFSGMYGADSAPSGATTRQADGTGTTAGARLEEQAATCNAIPGTSGTHDNQHYVVYQNEVRVGGSLAWRNNNPGNIRPGPFATSHGAIGSASGFAVFPDHQTGFQAIIALLQTAPYQSLTIANAIARYAPSSDHNDPQAYAQSIRQQTGLDPETRMNTLTEGQLSAVASAIEHVEGSTPGTTYSLTDPAAPAWVRALCSSS